MAVFSRVVPTVVTAVEDQNFCPFPASAMAHCHGHNSPSLSELTFAGISVWHSVIALTPGGAEGMICS